MEVNFNVGIIDMSPFKKPLVWLNLNSKFFNFDIQPFLEQLVIHMNVWGFNSQNDHSQTYLIEDFTIKANITWFIYDFINYSLKLSYQLRTLPSKATSWTPKSKLSTLTILLVFWTITIYDILKDQKKKKNYLKVCK
jgi:hypothetical protein